jgi:hypothetical protein
VKECEKAPKEERQESAHIAGVEVEQPTVLVAHIYNLVPTVNTTSQHVFLNQEHVFPTSYDAGSSALAQV